MTAISISEAYKFSNWKHASNNPSKKSFRFVCLIKPLEVASLNNSSWNVVFSRLCPVVVALQRMQIWRTTRWAPGTSYMKARLVSLRRKVMGEGEAGKIHTKDNDWKNTEQSRSEENKFPFCRVNSTVGLTYRIRLKGNLAATLYYKGGKFLKTLWCCVCGSITR